jgi:hypothetical protein
LDRVGDRELAVNDVTESFGGFLKILCIVNGIDVPTARDTFQVANVQRSTMVEFLKFPP